MPVASPFESGGSGGTVNLKIDDLTSSCDGSTQSFTVSSPYKTGLLQIYWNGLLQTSTEITEVSQTTFSTDFTPTSDDVLVAVYIQK